MKSIEYYTSKYFSPELGKVLTAEEWLKKKIEAAEKTKADLVSEDFMVRHSVRITRISNAIKDWTIQLNEINGIEKEVE